MHGYQPSQFFADLVAVLERFVAHDLLHVGYRHDSSRLLVSRFCDHLAGGTSSLFFSLLLFSLYFSVQAGAPATLDIYTRNSCCYWRKPHSHCNRFLRWYTRDSDGYRGLR